MSQNKVRNKVICSQYCDENYDVRKAVVSEIDSEGFRHVTLFDDDYEADEFAKRILVKHPEYSSVDCEYVIDTNWGFCEDSEEPKEFKNKHLEIKLNCVQALGGVIPELIPCDEFSALRGKSSNAKFFRAA